MYTVLVYTLFVSQAFLLTVISVWLATYFDSNGYILFRTAGPTTSFYLLCTDSNALQVLILLLFADSDDFSVGENGLANSSNYRHILLSIHKLRYGLPDVRYLLLLLSFFPNTELPVDET